MHPSIKRYLSSEQKKAKKIVFFWSLHNKDKDKVLEVPWDWNIFSSFFGSNVWFKKFSFFFVPIFFLLTFFFFLFLAQMMGNRERERCLFQLFHSSWHWKSYLFPKEVCILLPSLSSSSVVSSSFCSGGSLSKRVSWLICQHHLWPSSTSTISFFLFIFKAIYDHRTHD